MEEWRAIPGCNGYEASSEGRIRSLSRSVTVRCKHGGTMERQFPGRIRSAHRAPNGYLRLLIGGGAEGFKCHSVHRLVAAAFHGPCPAGMNVCHNDGDKTNNRAENLRYDTPQNNQLDKRAHGTMATGERNGAVLRMMARKFNLMLDATRKVDA